MTVDIRKSKTILESALEPDLITNYDKIVIKEYKDKVALPQLKRFIKQLVATGAHDVHLMEGYVPDMRVGGMLAKASALDAWGMGLYMLFLLYTKTIDKNLIFLPDYKTDEHGGILRGANNEIIYNRMYKDVDGNEHGPVIGRALIRKQKKKEDGKLSVEYYKVDVKDILLGEKLSHDISVTLSDKVLRCHFYLSQPELLTCAIRVAPKTVPEFSTLNLPQGMDTVIQNKKGLVLVSGGVGVGKTTTVNSLIQVLNKHSLGSGKNRGIIITVEDPVEFIHDEGHYKIIQRQVGVDTPSFSQASSDALRENADIVFLGELRTWEEMNNALQIAETNHLVISTIHSNGVVDTIERFVSSAPPEIQSTVRSRLTENLLGVVHQELIPSLREGVRVPLVSQLIIETEMDRDALRQANTREKLNNIFKQLDTPEGLKNREGVPLFNKSLTRMNGYKHLESLGLIKDNDISFRNKYV